jgi:hypothetical protein
MEGNKPYIIFFTYDVQDHRLTFPLTAEVECTVPGIYTISNIRPESQDEGALLPPIQLKKENGAWLFVDNAQESNLSNSIGRAIELRTNTTGKNSLNTLA